MGKEKQLEKPKEETGFRNGRKEREFQTKATNGRSSAKRDGPKEKSREEIEKRKRDCNAGKRKKKSSRGGPNAKTEEKNGESAAT